LPPTIMMAFLVPKPAAKPSQASPAPSSAAPEPPSAAPHPPAAAPEPAAAAPDELVLDRIVAEQVRLGSLHYRVAWKGAAPDSWIPATDEAWTDGSTTDVLETWQVAKAAAAAIKAEPKAAAVKAETKAAPAEAPAKEKAAFPKKTSPVKATLAEKVARIKTELGLDAALTLAQAVRLAQETLGTPPEGTLAAQVEALLRECGIEVQAGGVGGAAAQAAGPAMAKATKGKVKATKGKAARTPEPPKKKAKKARDEEEVEEVDEGSPTTGARGRRASRAVAEAAVKSEQFDDFLAGSDEESDTSYAEEEEEDSDAESGEEDAAAEVEHGTKVWEIEGDRGR